jgi:ASCH domain-containing protein
MKAISIRQPWAWLIVAGIKDIENRTWSTKHRGPLRIHASASKVDLVSIEEIELRHGMRIDLAKLQFGGIIGAVELVDVVTRSSSPWFRGPLGWVMREPRALPFMPVRGMQRLFDVPDLCEVECRSSASTPLF